MTLILKVLLTSLCFGASIPKIEVKPEDRNCKQTYAKLGMSKKTVAAAASGHAIAIGASSSALLTSNPPPKEALLEDKKEQHKSSFTSYFESKDDDIEVAIPILSRNEIIQRSQANLISWKNNKKFSFPIGEILIHSEVADWKPNDKAALKSALKQYEKDQKYLKKLQANSTLTPNEKIERAINYLHQKYFYEYCKDLGFLIGFFSRERCGNCQANTKLILANLIDAGFELPEGSQLTAQLYRDHIAPTIFYPKEAKSIDLVANESQSKLHAPLYEPSMLLFALLRHLKVKPTLALKELLVAGKPADGINFENAVDTNFENKDSLKSNTDFTGGGEERFTTGNIPNFDRMERASLHDYSRNRNSPNSAENKPQHYDYSEAVVEIIPPTDDYWYKEYLTKAFGIFLEMPSYPKVAKILVKNKEVLDTCSDLWKVKTEASIVECRNRLEKAYFHKSVFSHPLWPKWKALLVNPMTAENLTGNEMQEIAKLNLTTEKFLNTMPMLSKENEEYQEFDAEWSELIDSIHSLDKKLEKDPFLFIQFVSKLPLDKRIPFLEIVSPSNYYSSLKREIYPLSFNFDEQLPGFSEIKSAITDDSLVSLYRPILGIGPRDTVLFLNGSMNSGYTGYFQKPTGEDPNPAVKTTPKKSSQIDTISGKEDGGKSMNDKPKLAIDSKTMAAMFTLLKSNMASNMITAYSPNGYSGLGKFFLKPVLDQMKELKEEDQTYNNIAQAYFEKLNVLSDDSAKEEFLKYFEQEEFAYVVITSNVDFGSGKKYIQKKGPYPLYLAQYFIDREVEYQEKYKVQLDTYSLEKIGKPEPYYESQLQSKK